MRIGIYADLRNPPEWEVPWPEVYSTALERYALADEMGIDAVWFTEHHQFDDGYLPQPLTFGAAVAARTKRISIGMGVVLAPLRPAADIAEQAAMVDILSNGRLQLGLGAGYVPREFELYGVDIKDRYPLLEQRTQEIRALWRDGGVSPPPVQESIPIWIGAMGPRAAAMAGRLGEGLLWLDAKQIAPYTRGLIAGGHDPDTARMAGLVNMILADDPEEAWPRIAPHLSYQISTYGAAASAGAAEDHEGDSGTEWFNKVDPESMRSSGPEMYPPGFDVVTADEAVSRMRAWMGDMPVTEAFFWESIAAMPSDLAERHLELLATVVAPAVADLGVTPLPASQ